MTSPVTYLVATRSGGKLRELRELFDQFIASRDSSLAFRVIDLDEAGLSEQPEEEGIECFETFEENARAKAEYFCRLSGLPTFADDSGLAVHALQGAPGVRSKRWSGRTDLSGAELDAANNAKLIAALRDIPDDHARAADYVCAAAFADTTCVQVRVGRTSGKILTVARGANGFGYDPYFLSNELDKTFAEANTAEKREVSHRGRAFSALLNAIFAEVVSGNPASDVMTDIADLSAS